jgi:acetyl-CoA carboxylase biotin carboxyl carrier protein
LKDGFYVKRRSVLPSLQERHPDRRPAVCAWKCKICAFSPSFPGQAASCRKNRFRPLIGPEIELDNLGNRKDILTPCDDHFPNSKEGLVVSEITAPMGGKIIDVKVKNGDSVNEGDEVVILEAMKMELPIVATASGAVKEVKCKKGDAVEADEVLIVLG